VALSWPLARKRRGARGTLVGAFRFPEWRQPGASGAMTERAVFVFWPAPPRKGCGDGMNEVPMVGTIHNQWGGAKLDSHLISSEDIQQYRPVVRAVVRSICRRIPHDEALRQDLNAAGMAGLLDALKRRGDLPADELEWYARVRIRGAILDELRKLDWASRAMRVSLRRSGDEQARPAGFFSITVDSAALEELSAATAESPLDSAVRHADRRALDFAVQQLPERDGAVLRMHYFEAVPFNEIARLLHVTPARVSQIHARAIRELREWLS
jgi:RNA polymerase sigma factor for flagellar operon FliA